MLSTVCGRSIVDMDVSTRHLVLFLCKNTNHLQKNLSSYVNRENLLSLSLSPLFSGHPSVNLTEVQREQVWGDVQPKERCNPAKEHLAALLLFQEEGCAREKGGQLLWSCCSKALPSNPSKLVEQEYVPSEEVQYFEFFPEVVMVPK